MRVNNNPNLQLQNILGMEQAGRKEAQEKSAESAKAHEAEEALRLKEMSDAMKEIQGKRKDDSPKKGYRNASYKPDGSVQPEGPDVPEDPSNPPPPRGGIDLRA